MVVFADCLISLVFKSCEVVLADTRGLSISSHVFLFTYLRIIDCFTLQLSVMYKSFYEQVLFSFLNGNII